MAGGPVEREDREAGRKPLLATEEGGSSGDGLESSASSSSIAVVVASTAVAGSFEFGISVGYSSPSQPGIMRDLNLSIAEYSVFGSILTIGAMLGAIVSGTVADRVGRRWARFGHPGAFVTALQKLRGKETDISEEAEEIKDFTEKLQCLPKSKILDLFQKDYIHAVTVGVGLMVLQQFGGVNAIVFYASEIFVSAGFSSKNTGMLAMVAVQVPMTGLGVLLMDRAGRRPLLMEQHWEKDLNTVFALSGVLIFTGSFSLGMGGIPWVIMSEIFPINMKGSAGSLVTLVNWLGSWIVSYTFNFLLIWNSYGTFFIFASICGLTVVFVERLARN